MISANKVRERTLRGFTNPFSLQLAVATKNVLVGTFGAVGATLGAIVCSPTLVTAVGCATGGGYYASKGGERIGNALLRGEEDTLPLLPVDYSAWY